MTIHTRDTHRIPRDSKAPQQGPMFGKGGPLFPDSHGHIKHLALQLGNVEFDKPLPQETENALLDVWNTLFTEMAPDTKFTIVCADKHGEEAVRDLVEDTGVDPARVTVVPAECQKGMSIWIRDSMLPTEGGRLLIQDRTYWPGPEDNRVPQLIDSAHDDLAAVPHTTLRIDGGNVLSNRHQVIVGHDSIVHTRDRLRELAKDPAKEQEIENFYKDATGVTQVNPQTMWQDLPQQVFEHEFGKPVLVIGKDDPNTAIVEEQPAFHIDMAVTPLGQNKMLVGDPALSVRILKGLSPEYRAEVNQQMIEAGGFAAGSDIVGKLIEVNDTEQRRADFDNAARELKDAGYEVERIPSLIGLRTTWSLPYLTYNNCLMEHYGDVKKVYLPQYGCAPLDNIARQIYENSGYDVVPLNMSAVSKLEGAIRCSAYPVERTCLD